MYDSDYSDLIALTLKKHIGSSEQHGQGLLTVLLLFGDQTAFFREYLMSVFRCVLC